MSSKTPIKTFGCLLTILWSLGPAASGSAEIHTITKPADCTNVTDDQKFMAIHYRSFLANNPADFIEDTHERGVPIEITKGGRMVSSGLDEGLAGACVGERRRITVPLEEANIDLRNAPEGVEIKVIYEVEVLSASKGPTMATFRYLDTDGNDEVSREEMKVLINMVAAGLGLEQMSEGVFDQFMEMQDTNKDGLVTVPEFEVFIGVRDPEKKQPDADDPDVEDPNEKDEL